MSFDFPRGKFQGASSCKTIQPVTGFDGFTMLVGNTVSLSETGPSSAYFDVRLTGWRYFDGVGYAIP